VPDPSGPPSPSYEAGLEITYPTELNRWLPLVKWLLSIPHFIVLFFVSIGAFFALVYAFFVVLFTGRWPRGAFDFVVGTLRWYLRVLAYYHLMTDAYPPFSLDDDPNYPVRLNVEYPEHIANWRPLVQWLLAIPYLLVAGVLYWLTGILTIVAFFTVLFTRRIPREVFELMVPGLRWNVRGDAYAYFMSERYPPWVWG
jgi:energy-coupling factor transporter transmembrane protein EcfT